MKISEFANKYEISNDTVRYYMELNLITPEKSGGHYHFDEKCELQIREILNLKNMDFSLQEIKNIFNFKRIGKLSTYQQNNYYQSIYKSKYQDVEGKISDLRYAKGQLKEELLKLESKSNKNITKIGIDLSALSLFICLHCNSVLKLSAEQPYLLYDIDASKWCKVDIPLSVLLQQIVPKRILGRVISVKLSIVKLSIVKMIVPIALMVSGYLVNVISPLFLFLIGFVIFTLLFTL